MYDEHKSNILVVDDTPENLRFLVSILKAKGYKVRPASDGPWALSVAQTQAVDLILLDIRMPGMDGHEVCRRLKADERTHDIPVIFISALDDVADKVKGFAAGGVDYIVKPFREEEILARIRTHLELRYLRKRLEDRNIRLERKVAEEARFREMFSEHSAPMLLIEPESGRIVDANRAASSFYGYSHREFCKLKIKDIKKLPEEESGKKMQEAKSHQQNSFIFSHRLKGGEIRTVEVSSSPIEVNDERLLFSVIHDITEKMQTQEALVRAKEDAEAASRAKSEFLANMSHELRTPLNAIIGFSQILARSPSLDPEDLESVRTINRSGEHLLTLINQVLDLSKIESGRTTLNRQDFDLYALLDELEDMFRLRAEDKKLHLIFDRTPDIPPYIHADVTKLRQVLINLLNNAVKFTDEGGVALRVACGGTASGNSGSGLILRFEAEDTGPGIAPEELGNLFDAFVQTGTGRTAYEGTGLGLAISHKFVRLMGGKLSVRSEVGRGTVFSFEIRTEKADAADVMTGQPGRRVIALEPGQPVCRILIVDDREDNRRLMVKLLNPLGFALREAENGQEALEIWAAWNPHLIWMDMRMPVMDGYEATQHIKATTKGQATAIIALTASTLEEERAVILSAGCDDFVRKPFREADIFEAMHRHIGVRYVYEDEDRTVPEDRAEDEGALTPASLADLPPEVLEKLRQAVIRIDMHLMGQAVAEIRDRNPRLADALVRLIDDFEYDEVLNLIQEAEEDT